MPVKAIDTLRTDRDAPQVGVRKFDEYKPTNTPLSAADIEQRRILSSKKRNPPEGWDPRTTDNIDDIEPLPEAPPSETAKRK